MRRPPIRTVTLGLADAHPLQPAHIKAAAEVLSSARLRLSDAGYEVQTLRISTRSLLGDLADWSTRQLVAYARDMQHALDEYGLEYCSLGTAPAANPAFALERLAVIPELLATTSALSLTAQLADQAHGLRAEAALPVARVIQRLARETPEGFGNFRFAMLACVLPGTPFFPAAYHSGPASLTFGLQGAGLVREVAEGQQGEEPLALARVTELLRMALTEAARPVVALGQALAAEYRLQFGGIDLSPAPMGEDSIVQALEMLRSAALGAPGMVALAAAVTQALKTTDLPTCGYCGLMLPVLEDAHLGRRWSEGQVHTHELLLYSTVCGTGLDTVPLPGETSEQDIAQLLLDVATLAWRFNKPLSARLFPVMGKRTGEYTAFSSPYLTNTLLR